MDGLYLDNIDEYIKDHNKIVTYKWLSLTLGVHVNVAKQMLFHYFDQCQKDGSKQLHATYLVSGKCTENGRTCHKVSVVREDKLEDVKLRMDSTVSVHVYSLQKAEIKDSGTLYSTDYSAVKDNLKNCNKYSAIHCAASVPRSSVELEKIQEVQKIPSPEKPAKSLSSTNKSAPKSNVTANKGIMGMFSKKSTTKASPVEVKQEKEETPTPEPQDPKTTSEAKVAKIFFGTQATNKGNAFGKTDSSKKEPDRMAQPANRESKSPELPLKPNVVQEIDGAGDSHKSSKDSSSKAKRLQITDSDDEKPRDATLQKKKRRRIQKPQSESSEDEETPDKPTPAMVSPDRQAREQPSPGADTSGERKRKRRRVLKSKTFMDEEGCIVTEKVYESESYSEEETEVSKPKASLLPPPIKKEEAKKSAKKSAASNKSTKQASIMGFFQKK